MNDLDYRRMKHSPLHAEALKRVKVDEKRTLIFFRPRHKTNRRK
jgi:hypothetical protein